MSVFKKLALVVLTLVGVVTSATQVFASVNAAASGIHRPTSAPKEGGSGL